MRRVGEESPESSRIMFGLLDAVEQDRAQSQRQLASELGIALGFRQRVPQTLRQEGARKGRARRRNGVTPIPHAAGICREIAAHGRVSVVFVRILPAGEDGLPDLFRLAQGPAGSARCCSSGRPISRKSRRCARWSGESRSRGSADGGANRTASSDCRFSRLRRGTAPVRRPIDRRCDRYRARRATPRPGRFGAERVLVSGAIASPDAATKQDREMTAESIALVRRADPGECGERRPSRTGSPGIYDLFAALPEAPAACARVDDGRRAAVSALSLRQNRPGGPALAIDPLDHWRVAPCLQR